MKSRSTVYVLGLVAALSCNIAAASKWETSGYTGLGYVDESGVDDQSFSGSSSLVYRFNDTLGVEGGYTRFGDFKNNFDVAGGRAKAEAGIDGFTLGLNALINTSDSWYLTGRIGIWAWSSDLKLTVPGSPTLRDSADGTDLYAGAGFGYNFTERFGAGLGLTYFSVDLGGSNTGVYIVGLNTHYSF
jgi:OOP family OmpA-OmpF porin/outer membrane immunogenic protein